MQMDKTWCFFCLRAVVVTPPLTLLLAHSLTQMPRMEAEEEEEEEEEEEAKKRRLD